MQKIALVFLEHYFGDKLDFRVRLFNVLAVAGMALSLCGGMLSILNGEGIFSTIANFSTTVVAFALMHYASASGRYQLCYTITVIVIFVIAFSFLFFSGGGYESAMPSYFIFAVIITVCMLEGKKAVLVSAAELALYITLCTIAYRFPSAVTPLKTRTDVVRDTVLGFTVVSLSLGAAIFLLFRMYNRQRRELEEAKEALARQNGALEQISRMKTEFLGNVSHELKTPLTVVSGYAQLSEQMLEKPESVDRAAIIEKMKFISSEAERLALMVGQILDVTRIEEGRISINPVPCHADEIIHSAIITYFPILNKNNNKLEIHIGEGLSMVRADALRISQVIVNLIANAIRFTSAGTITVSAENAGPFVEIGIRDTGTGISPAMLPHIFERYTMHQSGGGRDTGTGLGLFICKHIIEEHGGEIKVESEQGKGTVIRFTVPATGNEPC